MERKFVSEDWLRKSLKKWIADEHLLYLGHSSITNRTLRKKYIANRYADNWPDLDGVITLMTPAEAARTELAREFGTTGRNGWDKSVMKYFDLTPPFFCLGPQTGTGVYIDIVSCYWQIYRKLTLDMKFPRLMGQKPLMPVAKKLENWKQARNALVGITISRGLTARKGSKIWRIKPKNPFLTPHLWATIQAILHELARLALVFQAQYCCTDGYIFPSVAQGEAFSFILSRSGIRHRKVIGDYAILGLGSWEFQNVRTTELFSIGRSGAPQVMNALEVHPYNQTYFLDWWASLPPKGDLFND